MTLPATARERRFTPYRFDKSTQQVTRKTGGNGTIDPRPLSLDLVCPIFRLRPPIIAAFLRLCMTRVRPALTRSLLPHYCGSFCPYKQDDATPPFVGRVRFRIDGLLEPSASSTLPSLNGLITPSDIPRRPPSSPSVSLTVSSLWSRKAFILVEEEREGLAIMRTDPLNGCPFLILGGFISFM
jgi:hypothetical protein